MDYEKKYKDAFERAKKFHEKELYAECNGNLVEYIFPELVESEDEKIRKEIVQYIKCLNKSGYLDSRFSKEWIAWLEKQCEQKPMEEHDVCDICDEQAGCINPCPLKLIGQKSIEWSEEDKEHLKDCILAIQEYRADCIKKYGNDPAWADCVDWLKSLKKRIQPQLKQEWSDEDYNEIETIACHLDNTDNEGMAEALRNIRDKYYHTIPQTTWKPSEGQIIELHRVISGCSYDIESLVELETKLKEL